MAISLGDILASLQNGAVAVNGLRTQLATTFPRQGEFSVTPRSTIGTITIDASAPVGFMGVTTSSGFTGYVPIYPSS